MDAILREGHAARGVVGGDAAGWSMRAGWLEGTAWVVALGVLLAPVRPRLAAQPTAAEQVAAAGGLVETLVVEVRGPPEAPTARRGVEAAGHLMLFVDLYLADLPGVVPRVAGVPENPGLALALASDADPWTVDVNFEAIGEVEVVTAARVCDPEGACTDHRVVGRRAAPNAAAVELVEAIGARLGRSSGVPRDVATAPLTSDDYAILMAGRAAATLYGLYPKAAAELEGDAKRDPVARAVFLDPRIASTWAVVARSTASPARRALAWKAASDAMPTSAALRAGYAAVLDAGGSADVSEEAWQGVAGLALTDMRFLVPRAKSALAVGHTRAAEEILALIPARYAEHPLVAAMNVAVADAHAGSGGADDALLSRWQTADPGNPEPVRRRIARFVGEGAMTEALALTPELARRGPVEEAQRLTLALASDLGRYAEAAEAADALGEGEVRRQLAALAAPGGEAGAAARAAALAGGDDPWTRLAWADVAPSSAEARAVVAALLRDAPAWPDALALDARLLAAAGGAKQAEEARAKLRAADPAFDAEGALARLAPRLSDLDKSVARTTSLLEDARRFQDQLAWAQSRFVAEGCATGACPVGRAAQLIVDAQAAGHEGRDLLQSARAELARAQRAAGCATVAPLLDERRQAALDALTRRTESASRGWLVRSAWYEERMASWAGRYRTEVAAACARPPGVEGASAEGDR